MPYLKLQTNATIEDSKELVKGLSRLIADELSKPENYVMVALQDETILSMAGFFEAAAYVELKSLGLPESVTARLSRAICDYLEDKANIPQERVYIVFSDIDRKMWGWNGGTF
ncbi:MAG: phenylpyruvate tautomerase MIF-related protein [Halanaerobiales bacterium]